MPALVKHNMITHLSIQKNWQAQLTEVITNADDLLNILQLDPKVLNLYEPKRFKLKVPRAFVDKMQKGNYDDPLLKQVLPLNKEQNPVAGYVSDPLAEHSANPITGLLHKYQSRVLLTLTGACAIHCRYCFRQHFDYADNLPKTKQIKEVTGYINNHPGINEVILSGGDPLSLSNRRLNLWLDAIEGLPQIQTIRIHSRLPVVIPERIDEFLLRRLQSSRCQIVMVIHCNHAQEIDGYTAGHWLKLKEIGVCLLNQTVLLKHVNDNPNVLVDLSHTLFKAGVLPYYLHVLDKVAGAAHFDCNVEEAIALYWQLLAALPGYLVPKLVQELPDKPFKVPVDIYKVD